MVNINGLVQDCSNSSALAMELLQFCTKPSIYFLQATFFPEILNYQLRQWGQWGRQWGHPINLPSICPWRDTQW